MSGVFAVFCREKTISILFIFWYNKIDYSFLLGGFYELRESIIKKTGAASRFKVR